MEWGEFRQNELFAIFRQRHRTLDVSSQRIAQLETQRGLDHQQARGVTDCHLAGSNRRRMHRGKRKEIEKGRLWSVHSEEF